MSLTCACCPRCGQPFPAAPFPEFVRAIDAKGRLTLPAEIVRTHGDRYAATWDGQVIRLEPDPSGRPAAVVNRYGSRRLFLPVELRQASRCWPGRDAALRRAGAAVLVWACREDGR